MAEHMVSIRSVKGYIKEFGIEAIGKKHADPQLVKEQILDAFHKEIFGQLAMKFGDPELLAFDIEAIDPETKRQVDNILSNSVRKWKRLCIEFSKFKETYNLLQPSDLMVTLEDIVQAQTNAMTTEEELEGEEPVYLNEEEAEVVREERSEAVSV